MVKAIKLIQKFKKIKQQINPNFLLKKPYRFPKPIRFVCF
ncbi:hypothetical protein C874_04720 [Elizabethkingia anophelis 502]|nr:hypothetical protein C874_04720 [Elizabethkingia anophelis 502]